MRGNKTPAPLPTYAYLKHSPFSVLIHISLYLHLRRVPGHLVFASVSIALHSRWFSVLGHYYQTRVRCGSGSHCCDYLYMMLKQRHATFP